MVISMQNGNYFHMRMNQNSSARVKRLEGHELEESTTHPIGNTNALVLKVEVFFSMMYFSRLAV